MPDEIQQGLSTYPGVIGFESVSYAVEHGKTPGRVIATSRFPPVGVASGGDFVITDGQRSLTVRDCKYQRLETEVSNDGTGGWLWTLYFLDRGWRWQTGKMSGHYNQRDTRGNLKPRTVKTFTQMAELCLKEMGEKKWDIDFPDGVTMSQVANVPDNPAPGQTTPPTSTNPEIVWDHRVPLDCLLDLCDRAGRRFMRCPVRDIVVIKRPGDGAALPASPRFISVADGLDATTTPPGVGVYGGLAMFQMRLKLVPVGLEWDGRYVPIDELSYRPKRKPQPGRYRVTFTGDFDAVYAKVNGQELGTLDPADPFNAAAAAAWLVDQIANNPALQGTVTATGGGGAVDIAGTVNGQAIDLVFNSYPIVGDAGTGFTVEQIDRPIKSAWDGTPVPVFCDVEPTDRLDYLQAQTLAAQSVFRCYRVADEDVSSGAREKTPDRPGSTLTIDPDLYDDALSYVVVVNGVMFQTVGQESAAGAIADLAAQITAYTGLAAQVTAAVDPTTGGLRITGVNDGPAPTVVITSGEAAGGASAAPIPAQPPQPAASKPIFVPYYGPVKNRDQIVLLTEKVEQVVPEKPNPDVLAAAGSPGVAGLPAPQADTYFGYSRGQQPTVYGAICNGIERGIFHPAGLRGNCPGDRRVRVPFVVDPVGQMIVFDTPVYYEKKVGGEKDQDWVYVAANLVLETAVNVLENDTYGPLRYLRWVQFGKPEPGSDNRDRNMEVDFSKYGIKNTPIKNVKLPRRRENIGTSDVPVKGVEWYPHEADVVYACIGDYTYDAKADRHTLGGVRTAPDDVSAKVADYYLLGHLLEHELIDAQTARYRGQELIPLDGAIQHVSWSLPGEVVTTASRNSSHGANPLTYPQRRRAENLDADPERAAFNRVSRAADGLLNGIAAAGTYVARLINGRR
ncbi:hypothetical protein [Limnoglobus roseus]|uniref:Uncharacterized protein n=1 Tax=Limnoglobus roseus TaxID=2598579 RepID=A0A5C1AHL1_9BACT|nr:hypothetical protein [Limnoglobus roseus]QEL18320.1 hypothetical protein PX52LOC_05341 [Limnoglobus roseus]